MWIVNWALNLPSHPWCQLRGWITCVFSLLVESYANLNFLCCWTRNKKSSAFVCWKLWLCCWGVCIHVCVTYQSSWLRMRISWCLLNLSVDLVTYIVKDSSRIRGSSHYTLLKSNLVLTHVKRIKTWIRLQRRLMGILSSIWDGIKHFGSFTTSIQINSVHHLMRLENWNSNLDLILLSIISFRMNVAFNTRKRKRKWKWEQQLSIWRE